MMIFIFLYKGAYKFYLVRYTFFRGGKNETRFIYF